MSAGLEFRLNSCNDNPQISIKYQLYGHRTTHCIVRTPQEVYTFAGYTYEKKITNRGHERAHQCGTSWLLMIFCFCFFCHSFLDFIGYFHVEERTRADAFKELALEMMETMIQNVHKLNDKQY